MDIPRAELEMSLSARALALVRRSPWLFAGAFVAVVGAMSWVYLGVRGSLVQTAAAHLRTLVDTEVALLETWIDEKRLNVGRWARDPRVVADVVTLVAAAQRGERDAAQACRGPLPARLVATIDTLRQGEAAASVNLIEPGGRVLASRTPASCGLLVPAAQLRALAPAFAGQPVFAGPTDEAARFGTARGAPSRPAVWISAPVRDDGDRVIAVLDVAKFADERFSSVLANARLGDTGEAYAFDAQGRMLSKSRFREDLEEAGRLRTGESEILRLRLDNPDDEASARVLTRIVESAIGAHARADDPVSAGELMQPYANYLGQPTVGAWRWLPQYGFGVAVEVAADEAYAPLVRLERAFAAVLTLASAALLFLVVTLARVARLRAERDEARRVGNYELLEQIGQGGMARVYRARHRLLKRPTAVKIIELAMASDEMLARFDREVRLASQLMHPNTVEVFDYGRTPEGQPFYAMEYLDGLTLQQVVEQHGPLPPARAAHALRGIAGSLAEAHERGLIHRDIKPANVMLCRRGGEDDVVKVLDFGLVKDTRTEATRDLTRTLRVLGTPSYMAPERIDRPDGGDFRADLYALGAVGYFLLAGRAPFEGQSDLALAYHVVHTVPPSLAHAGVPAALAELIEGCLAKDPAARPQTAAQIIAALDALLAATPWTAADARHWWTRRAQGVGTTAGAAGIGMRSEAESRLDARGAGVPTS